MQAHAKDKLNKSRMVHVQNSNNETLRRCSDTQYFYF